MFTNFTNKLRRNFSGIATLLLFFSSYALMGQGAYRSVGATGNWSAAGSWETYNGSAWVAATLAPMSNDTVYIQAGHTITLTGNAACADLHLHTSGPRLILGSQTLEVNGKIRAYTADVGTTPGAPSSSTGGIITTNGGVVKFVGAGRALTENGAWGAGGPVGADFEFALSSGTGTFGTSIKARRITFSSGNYTSSSAILGDAGSAPGDVIIKSGVTLTFTGASGDIQRASTGTPCDSVVLENGANLIYSGTPGEIDGTTIRLDGTVTYNISGTGSRLVAKTSGSTGVLPNTYNNLTLGDNKTLDTFTTVNGILNLTNSKLSLSDNNLTIGSSGSITGFGSGKYIVTDGSGFLIMQNFDGSPKTFPVGPSVTPQRYHPITITNSGTADNFSVNVKSEPALCGDTTKAVRVKWEIKEETSGGSNCTITADFSGASKGSNYNNANARLFDCSGPGPKYPNNGSAPASNVVTGSGFTSFSPFGVTSDVSILPVKLTAFDGEQIETEVQLKWSTSSETNSDYFEVQSSADGGYFRTIGKVKSAGTSTNNINYSLIDEYPYKGINYYQLKQVDLDGKYEYSDIIAVENTTPSNTAIYPALRSKMELNYVDLTEYSKEENISINLFDAGGRQIQHTNLKGGSQHPIDFGQLNTGLYFVKISNTYKSETLKFSVY